MKQIKKFSDSRLESFCSYCGDITNTRDHVPSKILIDKPYPENLPVVPACSKCNQEFSLDEEYVACLIECILASSTNPEDIKRDRVKRILLRKPALSARIKKVCRNTVKDIFFGSEYDRIKNVIMKLGWGHAAYENSEPQLEEANNIWFSPLSLISDIENSSFFKSSSGLDFFPEVGSRAFQRKIESAKYPTEDSDWLIVQQGRYRYSVTITNSDITIRVLLSEYLAGAIIW